LHILCGRLTRNTTLQLKEAEANAHDYCKQQNCLIASEITIAVTVCHIQSPITIFGQI